MVDGQVDGGMIEIGDPNFEPVVAEPPFKVVIEYRERGVPWMLIPPLLILAAVGAVLGYHKLVPPNRTRPTLVAQAPVLETLPVSSGSLEPVRTSTELPEPVGKSLLPVTPAPALVTEPVPTQEPPEIPPTFPRVTGLGFDPKALETARRSDPSVDPAISPTAKQEPVVQLPPVIEPPAIPAEPEKPREVAPELLPPDPRLAKARQQQRQAEALKVVEDDRTRFHTDLKAICRKYGDNCLPSVVELMQTYGTQVDPNSQKRAAYLLGKTGTFAGADRATRVDLLRSVGYPESLILDDIFVSYEKSRIGERDGPRDGSEAMYRSALFLLNNPPTRPASASKAAPKSTPRPAASPTPRAPNPR